jgi:hypothetical protein
VVYTHIQYQRMALCIQYIHRKKERKKERTAANKQTHGTYSRTPSCRWGATPVQGDQMKHLQNCQHLKSSPRHQIAEEDAKVNLFSFSVMPHTPSLEEVVCLSVCLPSSSESLSGCDCSKMADTKISLSIELHDVSREVVGLVEIGSSSTMNTSD